MKKISLAILLAMAMLLTLLPTGAMALDTTTRDTDGYDGAALPQGPDVSGNVWTVTPENAQYTLDGAYGSIDCKTINFSSGSYDEVLVLGRATKFSGSGTEYYKSIGMEKVNYSDINNTTTYQYTRSISDVKLTAEPGVELPGFELVSTHYANDQFDYVRCINPKSNPSEGLNSTYYQTVTVDGITFEGLTITGMVCFQDYMPNSSTKNINFINCTFQGSVAEMQGSTNGAIHLMTDTKTYEDVVVENCTITNYGQGVYIQGPDNVTIKNCVIYNLNYAGVNLTACDPAGSNLGNSVDGRVVIQENIIKNANGGGVFFYRANEVEASINNNVIMDCVGTPISASSVIGGDDATFDLENNYLDGKTAEKGVGGELTPPTEVGVSGGTFPIDVSEYANENFVAVEDENGNFVVKDMTEENAVATVNGVPYNDFHKAMLAAKSGNMVELLRDVTVESWQQIWNLSGVTVKGNNHTLKVNAIESGQNHDTVFHSKGNNRFYDLTIDLSGISSGSQAQGYKAICAAPGDSFERVKVISGEQVPVYGIFVGGTDAEDEVIYIRNCSFTNCSYAIGAEPTSGIASDLETLEVTGCTFTNCDYVGILYAEDVTFYNNSVTSGKLNIMHENQEVTNNTFAGASRIKFYADPAKFEKNDISAESCLEVVDAVESVDIAMNYWGGGAPSASQLGNAAEKFVGADEYYTSPNMDETNLYSLTIIYDNGMPPYVENNIFQAGDIYVLPFAQSRPGYIFMGWYYDGKTYQAEDTIVIKGDTVIRALWSALPDIEPGTPVVPDEPVVGDFPFTDVSVNAWYYEAVKYVYENGIMNGMDRYSFQPNGTLTRAMVWTMLARLDGVDTEGGANWYAKAQEWATATGVSDGENPTGEVTREQLITMLWRYAGSPTYTADLSGYVDTADISSWAGQAMCWAVATGVIEGDENSALTPKADTTRAQAAAMLMRAIEL